MQQEKQRSFYQAHRLKGSAMKFAVWIGTAVVAIAGVAARAETPPPPKDPLTRVIWDMFQMHLGKTVCTNGPTSVSAIRDKVIDHLNLREGDAVTPKALAIAVWALYPCPFSPNRPELRPATSKDMEGVWVFPEGSQKLRLGPGVSQPSPFGSLPVKCDVVGYFPNGETRHVITGAGPSSCPYQRAMDFDSVRKLPAVASWSLLRDGRVSIRRTDVENYIEEWDIYAVTLPFSAKGVDFTNGDLVAYNRRNLGNENGAATEFRHLQKLP